MARFHLAQTAKQFLLLPVLLVTLMQLSSCTVLGPDYSEPEITWLNKWEASIYSNLDTDEEFDQTDLQFWWQIFQDEQLNKLIELVRRENPSLTIAGLKILESRAALGIAKSSLYPQVQQVSGSTLYNNDHSWGGDLPDSSSSFSSFQSGFNLGWELDFWGRFKRGIESADAAFFASIANQQNLQVLLSAQVVDAYYAYYTALLQIDIARKNATIQKRSYEITERLYESGEKAELDLQQAKTQYMSTLSTIPGLEIALVQIRNSISTLLGRAPGLIPELDDQLKPLPVLEQNIIKQVPAQLLMRRPDIRAAAFQVAAQSAQIGIAEADSYPSITLLGNIGFSANTIDGSADSLSFSIGPSFTWNIFDHGAIENNIRIQDARLQQTIENFQNVAVVAASEINNSIISVIKTREQKLPQQASTQAANRSLELANSRYKEGYADFQRVLDAQRSAAAQAANELSNDSNHISAVISFYKAIGGGWNNMIIDEIIPAQSRDEMQSRTDWDKLFEAPLPNMQ